MCHEKMQDSISETRTFPEDIDDFDYLRARIAIYCAHVSRRLRAMDGVCGELKVFCEPTGFIQNEVIRLRKRQWFY